MKEILSLVEADKDLCGSGHREPLPIARFVATLARMFTGIVQSKVSVVHFDRNDFGGRLVVSRAEWTPIGGYEPTLGDSICLAGVCLTVVEATAAALSFDVIAETLRCTTLGELKPGDAINLEPALLPSQPLGGHFLQGHVDGVGTVRNVHKADDEWRITIEPPTVMMDYVAPKGSIAIDGVSLTVASVSTSTFDVALIPTTLELTTLAQLESGMRVNLESDMLARTVIHTLKRWQGSHVQSEDGKRGEPVTWSLLREAGFVTG
ncbi:riboflavin synthase [Phycisphaerales bacterium AB-hyl4]|uniref:Riboflavin synthase n=1 Tax=Natronomicrosphaera hydrolytica TaxID=3242702 RepID=A0ABV4U4Z2_9BACT